MPNPPSILWDAIVVGAGPAGCTAATLLAREGLRVLLLDKSAAPPPKVCGEYLSPGCQRILDRIGGLRPILGLGARPLSGMLIHTAGGRWLRATYPGDPQTSPRINALTIRRDRLDPTLLEQAVGTGTEYLPHFQASELVRENERIVGVSGRHRGRPAVFHGRLIIGADGRNSVVARRLGRVQHHRRLDKIAIVGYATGIARAEDVGEIFLGHDRYCILNPLAPDFTNIGLVINRRDFLDPGNPEWLLREAGDTLPYLGSRLRHARLVAPTRSLGPLARRATRLVAPGALVIGDAAGFFDPFTGEGIYAALRSAELAAASALPLLRAGSDPLPELREYATAWRQEVQAKWRLCTLFQYAIRHPLVAEVLVALLGRHPDITARLMGVVGDLAPVQTRVSRPLLSRLLARHASSRDCPEG